MFIQEINGGVQKPGGELVVCFPVEVMDIAGCDKGPGIVTGDQFPEFIKGDVGIIGGMGSEQWTWQALAGPQGVVQIEVFFPSFVEKGRTICRSALRRRRCCSGVLRSPFVS